MNAEYPDERYDDALPRRTEQEDDFLEPEARHACDDDDEYAGNTREAAISKVRAPAMLMFIGAIFATINSVGMIFFGLFHNLPIDADKPVFDFVYAGLGAMGVVLFAVATVGAACMKNLRYQRLAITSAVIMTSSLIWVSFWSAIFSPLGIWALFVLFDPKVDREFKQVRKEWANAATS